MKLSHFLLGAVIGGAFIYVALTAGKEPPPEPEPAQVQTCAITGNGTVKYVPCLK